jgi:hypothetical protein
MHLSEVHAQLAQEHLERADALNGSEEMAS